MRPIARPRNRQFGLRPRRGPVVLGVGLVLWLTVAGGAPASGQSAEPRSQAVFGIKAGLLNKTTLPGDHFNYAVEAGATVEDFVVLFNYTDKPITLSLYPADVRASAGGALAPAQRYETQKQVGAWITVDATEVTVPANGEVAPTFRLNVPPGTVPGDYVGAVVAALSAERTTQGFGLETRAARLIELRVLGEIDLGVTLSKPRAVTTDSGQEFEVVIANTGNSLFTFTGAISITGGSRPVDVPLAPAGIYVVPGGEARLTGTWDGPPMIGRRTAVAVAEVVVGEEEPKTFRSEPLKLTYIPWTIILVICAALLAGTILLVLTRRRRKEWRDRRRRERAVLKEVRAGLRDGRVPVFGQTPDDPSRVPHADDRA